MPRPEPIGEARGITETQPNPSNSFASKGSSEQ